jgi:hypothetical protein
MVFFGAHVHKAKFHQRPPRILIFTCRQALAPLANRPGIRHRVRIMGAQATSSKASTSNRLEESEGGGGIAFCNSAAYGWMLG